MLRQAIKLGLAATLAMACVKLLQLPSGFWAPLSALAVTQAQIGTSLVYSRSYLFASAVGVLIGAATLWAFGPNIPIAGVGIVVVVLICMRLGLPAVVSTAAGVMPVMVLAVSGSPWSYGWYRLLDVVIGLAAAILVSLLVWPVRAVAELRRSLAGAVRDAGGEMAAALHALAAGTGAASSGVERTAAIEQRLEAAHGLVGAALQEPSRHPEDHALLPACMAGAEHLVEQTAVVAAIAEAGLPHDVAAALSPRLSEAGAALRPATDALAAALASPRATPDMEACEQACARLNAALRELHTLDLGVVAGDDLIQAHTLVWTLEGFAHELDRMSARLAHPERPAAFAGVRRMIARLPFVTARSASKPERQDAART